MKTFTKGSGITSYVVQQTETVDELRAALREMGERTDSADPFEFALGTLGDDAEDWAKRTLDGATREAIATEHSREWYAANVLRILDMVRAEIAGNPGRRGPDAAQAAAQALRLGELLAEARIKFRWEKAALTGQKFIAGRKPGSGGPIRKAIARLLKKNPEMKNPELWEMLEAHPPQGWQFYAERKYIEGPKAGDGMSQGWFFSVCSEERKKLLKR